MHNHWVSNSLVIKATVNFSYFRLNGLRILPSVNKIFETSDSTWIHRVTKLYIMQSFSEKFIFEIVGEIIFSWENEKMLINKEGEIWKCFAKNIFCTFVLCLPNASSVIPQKMKVKLVCDINTPHQIYVCLFIIHRLNLENILKILFIVFDVCHNSKFIIPDCISSQPYGFVWH